MSDFEEDHSPNYALFRTKSSKKCPFCLKNLSDFVHLESIHLNICEVEHNGKAKEIPQLQEIEISNTDINFEYLDAEEVHFSEWMTEIQTNYCMDLSLKA
jgi:hypothetical protein